MNGVPESDAPTIAFGWGHPSSRKRRVGEVTAEGERRVIYATYRDGSRMALGAVELDIDPRRQADGSWIVRVVVGQEVIVVRAKG